MNAKALSSVTIVSLFVVLVLSLLTDTAVGQPSGSILVNTDKASYSGSETITVSGNVGTVKAGQPLLIVILNPQDEEYRFAQLPSVAADGSFSYSFVVGDILGVDGQYRVLVTYAGESGEAKFDYASEQTEGFQTVQLVIDDKSYLVKYQITGATLDDLYGDADSATITAEITAEDDGQLTIQLPREIADAKDEDGEDTDFIVILDDVGEDEVPDDDFGEDVRTLTIDFSVDTTSIDIVGTSVVPEFGTLAAIVLAVAIVGIIVATTKYGKFSFLSKF